MNNRLATTTATSPGSGVHSNIHQRAHNHASMVTNGQSPLISSTYVGTNYNNSRTAAAPSCHLMALARAPSSSQDSNAYCLSHDRRLNNNVSLTQSTGTPMSQPSLLQNNTQTVQVNEFIDNISRNTP